MPHSDFMVQVTAIKPSYKVSYDDAAYTIQQPVRRVGGFVLLPQRPVARMEPEMEFLGMAFTFLGALWMIRRDRKRHEHP